MSSSESNGAQTEEQNMLYTRLQAASYLGITDYAVGVLVQKGQLVPQNKEHIEQRKAEGRRGFPRFTMDELRRCKKARQEEELQKEEERLKKAEEAARLRDERAREKPKTNGVPISLSGVSVLAVPDSLEKKLDQVLKFMEELRPFMERLDKAML
jgi:hypothetical protein